LDIAARPSAQSRLRSAIGDVSQQPSLAESVPIYRGPQQDISHILFFLHSVQRVWPIQNGTKEVNMISFSGVKI
jgi:hypothetical protein